LEIEDKDFLLAKHYGYSLAVSILLGMRAHLSLSEIKTVLEKKLNLPHGRASAIQGKNHSIIIDSSYNASSMKDLIEMVGQIKNSQGRKLALLGDLRELGEQSASIHREIANLASKHFDQIFLVGQEMKSHALPILQKSMGKQVTHFDNSLEAGDKIAKLLKKNDLILVKGSQNTIFLEEAVKVMMKEPENAKQQLCRQSTWWLNIKRQAMTK
jgi:UDP-N-acetylmuramoyl-tripeptide--D-alanyl-D-alanine ligase